MGKFLKYTGICALLLAAVAFILMMATDAVVVGTSVQIRYSGVNAIFGNKDSLLGQNPSALALIGWILLLVGLVIVLLGVILPLLKVSALEKFAGILNLVAVICFILAGVFMFIVVPTFAAANDWGGTDNVTIGAGWVIGGILAIIAGVVAILPAVADFLGKK